MLTLVQFALLDNVVLIFEPSVKRDPRFCLRFILVTLLASIVLIKLVTALPYRSTILNMINKYNTINFSSLQ